MRLFGIAVLGLTLISTSAMAQVPEGKPVFGTYTCPKQVPCESYGGYSSSQWAQAATACLSEGFGFVKHGEMDIFDDTAGLNESNCVTTNTDAIEKGKNARILPLCCVVKRATKTCSIQCKLIQE